MLWETMAYPCPRYLTLTTEPTYMHLNLYNETQKVLPNATQFSSFAWLILYKFMFILHGPLTRYVKSWGVHAPGMPGTFSPTPTSKKTASSRSRHASQHVRHARVVMHVGIAKPRWVVGWGDVPGIPGACATLKFTYLARGP